MPNTATAIGCARCEITPGWARNPDGLLERCTCWLEARQKFADGVPFEFQSATLQNYRPLPGNEAAIAAAKAFGERDLYLVGGVGCGKTRLACSILNARYLAGEKALFARVTMLLVKLQPQADPDAQIASERLRDRLWSVPLLVLDDLGAETVSDFTRRTILTIYEERGDRWLRTIWTSNLALAGSSPTLAEFLGDDRLPSRIAGRAQIVRLSVSDQRLRRRVREDA